MTLLRRGMPVILMDCEAPEARMVAVLTRYDDELGRWYATYLSTFPFMARCFTSSWTPTPISDFGIRIEVDGDQFRCVPTGEPSRATYKDGRLRQWQDRQGVHWRPMRPLAVKSLDRQYVSTATEAAA